MIFNLPIYILFMAQILACVYVMVRVHQGRPLTPQAYLGLVLPAFLLVPLGVWVGIQRMPGHHLVIHGYRLDLNETGWRFFIGSDIGQDDIRFHYRSRGKERFGPGILQAVFQKGDRTGYRLVQTDPFSPNVVTVDGRPLRALELQPNVEHRISFGRFGYSTQPEHLLHVSVDRGKPRFRQGDSIFTEGFAREIMWGLVTLPYDNGVARHLGIEERIRFADAAIPVRDLLDQASIVKIQGRYWLAANDADIRLDGQSFPTSLTVKTGSTLRLYTRQLGDAAELRSVAFRILAPDEAGIVTIQLEEKKRQTLPYDLAAHRLCLTATESYFSDTYDIIDPQFPPGGAVINREGTGFVFRGQILAVNRLYSCGKAVFSIDRVNGSNMFAYAMFGLLFLASVFFLPWSMLKREPLMAVVVGCALFLLAFRQLLSFRAWQGEPFKVSTVMDSLIAPFLFMLVVLLLAERQRMWSMLGTIWVAVWNFFWRANKKDPPQIEPGEAGGGLIGLAVFGAVIFLLFRERFSLMFPALIGLALLASLFVGLLGRLEGVADFFSSGGEGRLRWKPAVILVPYLLGLLLLAPILGGKEVIAILPGRPRPDIFIQLFLLFMVAYFAAVWEREAKFHVPNPWTIFLTFAVAVLVPFTQGLISHDLGFFVMVALPLFVMLICATYRLDDRVNLVWALCLVAVIVGFLLIRSHVVSLDHVSLRRIAFFADKARIKAEYFFSYLAHLPMLWSSDQGFFGGGFFRGDWYPELAETSVNDNVAAVFVQGELGVPGTVFTMSVFSLYSLAIVAVAIRNRGHGSGFQHWFLVGIALMFCWSAATMFLANLGYFPLTGKNLPLLGIDSLNDVVRYGLLTGFALRYMQVLKEA